MGNVGRKLVETVEYMRGIYPSVNVVTKNVSERIGRTHYGRATVLAIFFEKFEQIISHEHIKINGNLFTSCQTS